MSPRRTARLDFHVHSRASSGADDYVSRTLHVSECYSDPRALHARLTARGMDLVTLTDHGSIDGNLALLDAGFENVFLSTELTARFPEDGCGIRVIVANPTEAQFREMRDLGDDVYDLVAYLDAEIAAADAAGRTGLAYFMAHPLDSVRNRPYGRHGALSVTHLEKAALLFACVEARNGARTRMHNETAAQLFSSLTPEIIGRFADRHGIEPRGPAPWKKAMVGGSDDRAVIRPGRTWTEFPYDGDRPRVEDLVAAIRDGTTQPGGEHGGPVTRTHQLLKRVHDAQSCPDRPAGARRLPIGGSFDALLGVAFQEVPAPGIGLRARMLAKLLLGKMFPRPAGAGEPLGKFLEREAIELLGDLPFLRRIEATSDPDERMFTVVSALTDRIFSRCVDRFAAGDLASVLQAMEESIARVSSQLFVSLPYVMLYVHSSSQKALMRDVRQAFDLEQREKLVLVTDTLFDVNGVARTVRKVIREAVRRDIDLTVVVALHDDERAGHESDPEIAELVRSGRLRIFRSLANVAMPHYPDLTARFVPFLEFLRYCQEQGFTKMQISTPGPVGTAGLVAAKLLQIETSSTYHTAFPEYVEDYTGDVALEALAWKFMVLFYGAVDEVVVPSAFIGRLLRERGLRRRRVLVLDRWVDEDRFTPRKRSETYWQERGLRDAGALVKFVYLGRVGAEKSLDILAAAYVALRRTHERAHLIVIGDGPYRRELERLLEGVPATFTGFLEGGELETALASCDAKLFPSTTDSWGNAPLEAQASGLPVVVSDQGGPQELMRPDVTGFRVRGGDAEALRDAMERLMEDDLRARMGEAARAFVERNRVDEPFSAILDADAYRRRRRDAAGRAARDEPAPAASTAAPERPRSGIRRVTPSTVEA